MPVQKQTIIWTHLRISLSRTGKTLLVLINVLPCIDRFNSRNEHRLVRIDFFDDRIRMRRAQKLYDQTIFRRNIIRIYRLTKKQFHCIFFTNCFIYFPHDASSFPLSSFVFFHPRKFKIPRNCPSYPEQRQRFPERYSLISFSSGCGFSRKSAMAFITNPGLQNPHCSAPWSAIKATNSSASSCNPSNVVTLLPSARAARMEQESTGFSFKNTVQSPQLDVSQPRLTL